jgi:5-methyltetrahydropteroyltriglutamate--homocysteine methyltransferase
LNRSTDRILTTHTGSLVRTLDVIEGMKARTLGDLVDEAVLEESIVAGIGDAVRRQVAAGVDIPSDGEYGRQGFNIYIEERIGGLERVARRPDRKRGEKTANDYRDGSKAEWEQFPGFSAQYSATAKYMWVPPEVDMSKFMQRPSERQVYQVVGPLRHVDTAVQRDIANLRAALDGLEVADAFITAVTPTTKREHTDVLDFYTSFEAYEYALADAMREEYKAITDSGFILQLDRPALDPLEGLGSDEEMAKALEAGIEVTNYALRGIPEDRVRLHWCGGSGNRPHVHNIPMAKVAKSMLKLNVGAYGFEAANPRHEHEWQIWEDIKLPDGKIIVPGVISQSTNVVEHPELIAWRIKNFARLVGRENVIAGVDCGFSQFWHMPRVHSEVQWAKLHALAEGAAIASEELWSNRSAAMVAEAAS